MDENLIIQKIIKLEEDMKEVKETMSTKMDIREILNGQDKMIKILERVDQERVFTKSAGSGFFKQTSLSSSPTLQHYRV